MTRSEIKEIYKGEPEKLEHYLNLKDEVETSGGIFTDEGIICPHCFYRQGDEWEMNDEEDNFTCVNCEKKFSYTKDITVYYSSSLLEEEDNDYEEE